MSIHSSENFSDARGPGRHAWCGLLLAIVPGFGQFYHRQWLKGLVFLVLLSSFMGIFYDFLREGLWGLYTLGEEVPRDNSIFLLAEGIISVLIVAFGVLIYFSRCGMRGSTAKNAMRGSPSTACVSSTRCC